MEENATYITWGASQSTLEDEFHELQNHLNIDPSYHFENFRRWQEGLDYQLPLSIPAPAVIVKGDYRLLQLPKTDPRGVFAGHFTGCCQHPQSWGHPCAWHGHESPNGAFWAVERHGKIDAVAWVWRYASALVVDSVETSKKELLQVFHDMYGEAAQTVLGKMGVEKVYAGVGIRETWVPDDEHELFYRPFPSPAPYMYQSTKGQVFQGDDSKTVHLIAHV